MTASRYSTFRGYDYEASVVAEGGLALGLSSMNTTAFGSKLHDLLETDARVFTVLSPKDVYWETADAQRYFGDYDRMIQFILGRPLSIYQNALCWQKGVTDLLDRMDHYVVYVSSITESVLWELEQLDTDETRRRVTVVFDEAAIANKEMQLAVQDRMQDEHGERLIWSKKGPPPALTVAELRAQLSEKFVVTTPDEFEELIDRHREHIAQGSSRLGPGARETWIDFRFYPAVDSDKLAELRGFSADLQAWIDAARNGIECLPLFLNQIQLRIYTTLLLGEHDHTGRALAAYAGVMRGALDYFEPSSEKVGDLSPENREKHLEMLREHLDMAEYAGVRLLAYGRSHQFDDFSADARAEWNRIFEATTVTVARFFEERGGPLTG
jgi:hypothetical protein